MRISDWSSDVCSSDLAGGDLLRPDRRALRLDGAGAVRALPQGRRRGLEGLGSPLQPGGAAAAGWLLAVADPPSPHPGAGRPRGLRSEERRVGKEWFGRCRSGWSPYHKKKKKHK